MDKTAEIGGMNFLSRKWAISEVVGEKAEDTFCWEVLRIRDLSLNDGGDKLIAKKKV